MNTVLHTHKSHKRVGDLNVFAYISIFRMHAYLFTQNGASKNFNAE